ILEGKYLNYNTMDKVMQKHEAYRELPTKVAQMVVKQVHEAWVSYFKAMTAYREHPEKFQARPKLPGYKDKTQGRNLLVYTLQALQGGQSKKGIQGTIKPSGLPIEITTRHIEIKQVRIVPRKGYYVVEVIYEHEQPTSAVNPAYYAGIDIGLETLAALTSNQPGYIPVLVNGRPMKSINQFYNKRRAALQSELRRKGTTKRMERLTNKRNRRIDHYMHTASRWIIDDLVAHGIGTLVIGKNDGWKQEANMGKRTNQHFVGIPHARFIQMLSYKAERVGITVIITEESYTSRASFLDRDSMPVYDPNQKEKPTFSGKRIKRGLYRAADGTLINADCNGSSNIIRKVAPDAFESEGVEDGKGHKPVVHPVRLVVAPAQSQKGKSRAREKTLEIASLFGTISQETIKQR
ncbi:MAG TPA: transposase, partial [Ktedonobacteraceae bacterium]|nr:transposase [Ktedonobacteraceae bacterium]